jgi:glycosyltransferase involved in cell wall biosynthesis
MVGKPDPLSICIVSHNGYATLTGAKGGFIGGVEWQTSLLARWLVNRGHQVSFLTWDEGGPAEEDHGGVRVIKICRKSGGLPGLRFFHPKWTGLLGALRKANADVYYHNCGECVTGQVSLWCRRHSRALVFTAANDTDCDAGLPELRRWRDRFLYRLGLRRASRVIVQTATQQRMMKENFGVAATVIPMPCQPPSPPVISGRSAPPIPRVLWVARVCHQKRPDRLMELAASMPDIPFDVVGPHYSDDTAAVALKAAKDLANVTVHGPLPRERIAGMYQSAGCLVCTSDYEGFPNTFLEAWSHALPIVSTFDPDGLIAGKKLGLTATDMTSLRDGVRTLMEDRVLYQDTSANALAYFQHTHSAEQVLPLFEKALVDAACQSGRPTS